MKRLAFAAAAVFALVGQPARADEAATNFVKLFNDVCIAKFGHLTAVWDWADSQNWRRSPILKRLRSLRAGRTKTAS